MSKLESVNKAMLFEDVGTGSSQTSYNAYKDIHDVKKETGSCKRKPLNQETSQAGLSMIRTEDILIYSLVFCPWSPPPSIAAVEYRLPG